MLKQAYELGKQEVLTKYARSTHIWEGFESHLGKKDAKLLDFLNKFHMNAKDVTPEDQATIQKIQPHWEDYLKDADKEYSSRETSNWDKYKSEGENIPRSLGFRALMGLGGAAIGGGMGLATGGLATIPLRFSNKTRPLAKSITKAVGALGAIGGGAALALNNQKNEYRNKSESDLKNQIAKNKPSVYAGKDIKKFMHI